METRTDLSRLSTAGIQTHSIAEHLAGQALDTSSKLRQGILTRWTSQLLVSSAHPAASRGMDARVALTPSVSPRLGGLICLDSPWTFGNSPPHMSTYGNSPPHRETHMSTDAPPHALYVSTDATDAPPDALSYATDAPPDAPSLPQADGMRHSVLPHLSIQRHATSPPCDVQADSVTHSLRHHHVIPQPTATPEQHIQRRGDKISASFSNDTSASFRKDRCMRLAQAANKIDASFGTLEALLDVPHPHHPIQDVPLHPRLHSHKRQSGLDTWFRMVQAQDVDRVDVGADAHAEAHADAHHHARQNGHQEPAAKIRSNDTEMFCTSPTDLHTPSLDQAQGGVPWLQTAHDSMQTAHDSTLHPSAHYITPHYITPHYITPHPSNCDVAAVAGTASDGGFVWQGDSTRYMDDTHDTRPMRLAPEQGENSGQEPVVFEVCCSVLQV